MNEKAVIALYHNSTIHVQDKQKLWGPILMSPMEILGDLCRHPSWSRCQWTLDLQSCWS